MIKIFRTLILLALIINSSACVSLDRMLNPISNHTHHYSFTNNDIVNGGILVAGFVASDSDDDSYVAHKDADAISDAINNERKEYKVSSAKSLKMVLSEEH